jgi:hypothetical protein
MASSLSDPPCKLLFNKACSVLSSSLAYQAMIVAASAYKTTNDIQKYLI